MLRTIFSQAFLKDFSKCTCDFPLYGIVNNLIIYFAEASQYFFSWSIYNILLLFSYQVFGVAFFLEHLPVVVSANTCLKVTSKKFT